MIYKPKRKLRVIALVREDLIPPDTLDGVENKESQEWRTEYDVVTTLRGMGHEVRPVGVGSEVGPINCGSGLRPFPASGQMQPDRPHLSRFRHCNFQAGARNLQANPVPVKSLRQESVP